MHTTSRTEEPLSDWVCLGESVLIRPSNASGVVAFIGTTHFASGTWVGVDLDAPTGIALYFGNFYDNLLIFLLMFCYIFY